MSSHLKALQQALNTSTQRPSTRHASSTSNKAMPAESVEAATTTAVMPSPQANEATSSMARGGYMAPSREGKTNITAYLSPDYKSSLRLIQARTGKSLQDLIAEALNDMFSKYDVPVIRED